LHDVPTSASIQRGELPHSPGMQRLGLVCFSVSHVRHHRCWCVQPSIPWSKRKEGRGPPLQADAPRERLVPDAIYSAAVPQGICQEKSRRGMPVAVRP
jgi:hypothetical protein